MNDKIVSAEQDQAFCKSKELLTFVQLLVHCDSTKETVLACDASLYGISAVISCIIEDGTIYPTPPLGQDMTQGQFLSGV